MERLHNYMYGKPVRAQTDHKPLETIWKKLLQSESQAASGSIAIPECSSATGS